MAENINEITCINIWFSSVELISLSTSKLSITKKSRPSLKINKITKWVKIHIWNIFTVCYALYFRMFINLVIWNLTVNQNLRKKIFWDLSRLLFKECMHLGSNKVTAFLWQKWQFIKMASHLYGGKYSEIMVRGKLRSPCHRKNCRFFFGASHALACDASSERFFLWPQCILLTQPVNSLCNRRSNQSAPRE